MGCVAFCGLGFTVGFRFVTNNYPGALRGSQNQDTSYSEYEGQLSWIECIEVSPGIR